MKSAIIFDRVETTSEHPLQQHRIRVYQPQSGRYSVVVTLASETPATEVTPACMKRINRIIGRIGHSLRQGSKSHHQSRWFQEGPLYPNFLEFTKSPLGEFRFKRWHRAPDLAQGLGTTTEDLYDCPRKADRVYLMTDQDLHKTGSCDKEGLARLANLLDTHRASWTLTFQKPGVVLT